MSEKCGTLCKHGFLEAVCERCKMADQIAAMTKERDSWKAKAEANERIKLFAGILLEYFIPDPCDVDGEFFERAAIKCGLFIRISKNNWALSDSGMRAVDAARSAEKEKE